MITKNLYTKSKINFGYDCNLKDRINNNRDPNKIYHCAYGGEKFTEEHKATAEHIILNCMGGPDETANFLMVCKKHNKGRANIPFPNYLMNSPEIVKYINLSLKELSNEEIEDVDGKPVSYVDEVTKRLLYAAEGHLQINENIQLELVKNPTPKQIEATQRQYLDRTSDIKNIDIDIASQPGKFKSHKCPLSVDSNDKIREALRIRHIPLH